jgi:transcriptional regulator with XRE-family HTH domain
LAERSAELGGARDTLAQEGAPHFEPLRESAGLTQVQLAGKSGLPQSNITFWERSEKPPRGEVLVPLANALGVGVEVLLGAQTPKPKRPAAKGRLQQVFEATGRLPRRRQETIIEVIQALLAQHREKNAA